MIRLNKFFMVLMTILVVSCGTYEESSDGIYKEVDNSSKSISDDYLNDYETYFDKQSNLISEARLKNEIFTNVETYSSDDVNQVNYNNSWGDSPSKVTINFHRNNPWFYCSDWRNPNRFISYMGFYNSWRIVSYNPYYGTYWRPTFGYYNKWYGRNFYGSYYPDVYNGYNRNRSNNNIRSNNKRVINRSNINVRSTRSNRNIKYRKNNVRSNKHYLNRSNKVHVRKTRNINRNKRGSVNKSNVRSNRSMIKRSNNKTRKNTSNRRIKRD